MSQTLAKNYIHLVFSTKGRTETVPKQHLTEIHSYMAGILNANKCPAICVGGTPNHVHLLFCLGRSKALSDVVRTLKSCSSQWINERNGSPFNHFCWQDGYGAFSISQSHVPTVSQYIDSQEEHHKKVSFQDEFRRICALYHAGLDERYAWD